MKAMIIKEFRELRRDRRTVALLVLIPFLLLVIFGYAANFTVETSKVLVTGPAATAVAEELNGLDAASSDLEITVEVGDLGEARAEEILRDGTYAAVVESLDGDADTALSARTHLWVDGSQLFAAQSVTKAWMSVLSEDLESRIQEVRDQVTQARADADAAAEKIDDIRTTIQDAQSTMADRTATIEAAMQALQQIQNDPATALRDPQVLSSLQGLSELQGLKDTLNGVNLDDLPTLPDFPDTTALDVDTLDIDSVSTTVFNPDLKTSWIMIPGLIGLILTFVGTIVTSIGLVREREAGTLEQLAAMPLSSAAIIGGKVIPYLVLALIDAAIITVVGVWLFGVPFRGSLWVFSLIALVFVWVVLGVGVLISSVSQNTGQAIQLALMTMMPQILLSGLVFPLDAMAAGVRWIGYCLPLTWMIKSAQGVMLKGSGLADIAFPLGILCVMAVVVFGAAIVRMSHTLRTGGSR